MSKEHQHRLGQHYTSEEELVKPYAKQLLRNAKEGAPVVDPFCGEGHLLYFYLELFDENTQKKMVEEKKVWGFDLHEENIEGLRRGMTERYGIDAALAEELFQVRDSLTSSDLPKNPFIFTNPPYLAKNVCKKKYPEDFERYFGGPHRKENDYFEIALKMYGRHEGVWIVPSNFVSSDIMNTIRRRLMPSVDQIRIYLKKTFEDTDITVCTFHIDPELSTREKEVWFIGNAEEKKDFELSRNYNLVEEWDDIKLVKNFRNISHGYLDTKMKLGSKKAMLINQKYQEEEFLLDEADYDRLKNNVLILRTTDTGAKDGKIGLYTIEELWGSKEAIGLVTKISSRIYTQIFTDLSLEGQLKLKKEFNAALNELRTKYNSIFLTNYKNSSNGEQRKRIAFKEAFSLMNSLLK